MELWNEYEGRTIAGSFPLEALLRPEGRSAFFATTTAAGVPTVIRLIESHFDEDEILARWKAVAALNQPNLLTMPHIGHLLMDDTALVYAVMEPTDADLGQILRERRLTATETHQVATSLVAALLALRSIGMVHEHLQPMNVLAVGETVKLRSDCVRYAPEGPESTAAYTRDVQDLCTLLLQCLTLEKTLAKSATYSASLPAPFREIVANGLEGRWGLAEIATSLARSAPLPAAVPATNTASKPADSRPPVPTKRTESAPQTQSIATAKAAQPSATPASATVTAITSPAKATPPASAVPPAEPPVAPMFNPNRNRRNPPETTPRDPRLFRATIAAIIVFLVFVFALRVTRRSASPHPSVPPSPVAQTYPSAANASVPAAPTATAQPEPQPTTSADNQPWRVVAYTYNKQSQAQAKADALSKQHRGLKIEVFTPTGRAPYLVTIGGPMTRAEAFALKSKLRGNGFPRDLYAQNYGSHTVQHARGRHQR